MVSGPGQERLVEVMVVVVVVVEAAVLDDRYQQKPILLGRLLSHWAEYPVRTRPFLAAAHFLERHSETLKMVRRPPVAVEDYRAQRPAGLHIYSEDFSIDFFSPPSSEDSDLC